MLSPSTNQGDALGTTLRAVGNEHCAGLVRRFFWKPSRLLLGEGNIDYGNLTDAIIDSSGVMVAARREGSRRNWGGPPSPEEKDFRAR